MDIYAELNLSRVLRAAFEHDGNSRDMQADVVLETIYRRLRQAQRHMDRHEMRCRQRYLEYLALKTSVEKGAGADDD